MFDRFLIVATCLGCSLTSVASADELPEQRSVWVQTTSAARYDRLPADVNSGRVQLQGRALLGRSLGYGLGLSLQLGAAGGDLVYQAELLPLGLGVRFGDTGAVFAGLGLGVDGGARSSALLVPVELRARLQLGAVRLFAHTTARAAPLDDARDLELEGTVAIGWGQQKTYWSRASAGSGPYLAVGAQELGDELALSVSIGLELLGAN